MNDGELILSLGGATKVAKLLNYDLGKGGAQKVHNWITRGIPPKVKLDNKEIFLNITLQSKGTCMTEKISFSRTNRLGDEVAELRVNSPKYVLAVVDSVAISETKSSGKMVSRTDIVNRILSSFVDHKIDEATLINRAINDHPTVLDEGKS